MGTCQSSLCQCSHDEVDKSVFVVSSSDKNGSRQATNHNAGKPREKHLIFDLLSPAYTEATTPTSTGTLITPHNGRLSLSVISSCNSGPLIGSCRSSETAKDSRESRQPSKFTFDTPHHQSYETSCGRDVHDSRASLDDCDEEDPVCCEKPNTVTSSPKSNLFGNPPLLAPPPGQADLLWQKEKARRSVNDHMVRDFNRLRRKASIVQRQEKQRKKSAKMDDRLEDIRTYRNLWSQFVELEQLRSETVNHHAEKNGTNEQDTSDTSLYEKAGTSPDTSTMRASCLPRQSTRGWFVSKSMNGKKQPPDTKDKGGANSKIALLLSSTGMEAQKVLQQERHAARMHAKQGEAKVNAKAATLSRSKEDKPYVSYFEAVHEPAPFNSAFAGTPQLSPPRLQVLTNATKASTLPLQDYGPSPPTKQGDSLLTDMEVLVESNDKKRDDASGISHDDFESDFSLQESQRSLFSLPRDDLSFVSSSASLGPELRDRRCPTGNHALLEVHKGTEEYQPLRRNLQKSRSHGVSKMSRKSATSNNTNKPASLVSSRIANFEENIRSSQRKQKGFIRQDKHCVVDDNPSELSDHEASPSLGVTDTGRQSHIPVVGQYTAFESNDLEPTNLEEAFDTSNDIPGRKSLIEKIVMRNASHCQRQQKAMKQPPRPSSDVALMSTDEFRRMSRHSWVNVVPKAKSGSYVVETEESSPDSCLDVKLPVDQICSPNLSDVSALANEVGAVLSKYRGEGNIDEIIVDAHELLQYGAFDSGEPIDASQGKLFCA